MGMDIRDMVLSMSLNRMGGIIGTTIGIQIIQHAARMTVGCVADVITSLLFLKKLGFAEFFTEAMDCRN